MVQHDLAGAGRDGNGLDNARAEQVAPDGIATAARQVQALLPQVPEQELVQALPARQVQLLQAPQQVLELERLVQVQLLLQVLQLALEPEP